MNQVVSTLTVPGRMDYVRPVIAYVRELAEATGFNEEEVNDIHLAIEEAVSNVIEHGFAESAEGTFDLICEQTPTGLTFAIKQKGTPFDPNQLPVYSPDFSKDQISTAGLGLHLMKASVDEVSFLNLGRGGQETRLTKYLRSKRIDRRVSSAELAPDAPPNKARTGTHALCSFHVRPFVPDDAIEVSKCAYKAYGYTYDDYIYYPERIVDLNQKGRLFSAVAVSSEGEMIGHQALKFASPGARTAEIGVAFINPKFRGSWAFYSLSMFLLDKARQMGLRGICTEMLANNIPPQRGATRVGLTDCAILLAAFPFDVDYQGGDHRAVQKESGLLSYLPLSEWPPLVIYPPPQHRSQVDRIYAAMRAPVASRDPAPSGAPLPPGEATLRTSKVDILNAADVEVLSYGENILHEVKAKLRAFCLEHTDVVYLYLNLEEPLTGSLAGEFEKLGFFFAGILPGGASGHEALILQYLNNVKIDYGQIKPYSSAAKDLLAYVRSRDPLSA